MRYRQTGTNRQPGFTLIELLIVMAIILLLSVAVLPVVWTALQQQEMHNAAQLVQSTLSGVRDTAIRAGQPHGVRLLLDPALSELPTPSNIRGGRAGANRMQFLEPAPNYSEGKVTLRYWQPSATTHPGLILLRVDEYKVDSNGVPQPPTGWFYNIRQGDKIQLGGSSHEYTIVGPLHNFAIVPGPISEFTSERFVNLGEDFQSYPGSAGSEFLILLNGIDDDDDGYIDEAFDGIGNDVPTMVDPAFPGADQVVQPIQNMLINYDPANKYAGQYERERFLGNLPIGKGEPVDYKITRRPMPASDGREIALPGNVVIDLTTTAWLGPQSERSRVPMDPITGFVDIMIYPNGQVIPSTPYGNPDQLTGYPFYHLWLTKREDVYEPQATPYPRLPMPVGVAHPWSDIRQLQTDRRLISLSTRTGQTATHQLPEDAFFSTSDPNAPFADAEGRTRMAPPPTP